MSAVNEILKAVRDVVIMNERVTTLSRQVEKLAADHSDLRERVIRIEAFIDMVRPAVSRRELPAAPEE